MAELSRIKLTDGEVESLQKDISNILDYVGQIQAFEVGDAAPVMPLHHNVMREDVPRSADDVLAGKEETIRAAFPLRENNFNVVRKIIQKNE